MKAVLSPDACAVIQRAIDLLEGIYPGGDPQRQWYENRTKCCDELKRLIVMGAHD